jgi:HD-GYP domain-containing protein (c-di-GMP phosphodiesterase class II)
MNHIEADPSSSMVPDSVASILPDSVKATLKYVKKETSTNYLLQRNYENTAFIAAGLAARVDNHTVPQVQLYFESGLVHDVGKSDPEIFSLIGNGRALSEEESSVVQQHPSIGYTVALEHGVHIDIAHVVLYHHVWWDGNGYPSTITPHQNISDMVWCVELADAIEASMDPNRIYRHPLTPVKMVQDISAGMGTHFHPKLHHTLHLWYESIQGQTQTDDPSWELFMDTVRSDALKFLL